MLVDKKERSYFFVVPSSFFPTRVRKTEEERRRASREVCSNKLGGSKFHSLHALLKIAEVKGKGIHFRRDCAFGQTLFFAFVF